MISNASFDNAHECPLKTCHVIINEKLRKHSLPAYKTPKSVLKNKTHFEEFCSLVVTNFEFIISLLIKFSENLTRMFR